MRIPTKSHMKRNVLLFAGVPIILIALAVGLELAGVTDFIHTDKSAEANQKKEKQTNLDNKKDFIDKSSSGTTQKTTDQVPVSEGLKASITQLEQKDNLILFSAAVENASSAGSCTVTFSSPNDKPVVKEVDASMKDGVALCGPLNISSLEFSYLGEWQVTLRYYLNDEQAVATGKITIR